MSYDTWIHKGVRVAVRPLVKTPVTPNQITALRLISGLGAAALYAIGTAPWTHVGGALFVLSVLLDRADGELARLGGKTSPGGHAFDLIADAVCNALVLVGIGWGLRQGVLGPGAVPMGIAAGAAVAAIFWMTMRIEEAAGAGAAELGSAAGFDADDAVLVIPIAMWLGGGVPLLTAAAAATPAFAVFYFLRSRRRLSARRPEGADP